MIFLIKYCLFYKWNTADKLIIPDEDENRTKASKRTHKRYCFSNGKKQITCTYMQQ